MRPTSIEAARVTGGPSGPARSAKGGSTAMTQATNAICPLATTATIAAIPVALTATLIAFIIDSFHNRFVRVTNQDRPGGTQYFSSSLSTTVGHATNRCAGR
jgi:hypothetical protein